MTCNSYRRWLFPAIKTIHCGNVLGTYRYLGAYHFLACYIVGNHHNFHSMTAVSTLKLQRKGRIQDRLDNPPLFGKMSDTPPPKSFLGEEKTPYSRERRKSSLNSRAWSNFRSSFGFCRKYD